MLQSIRDNTKGWIAYVIIGLLIVPFALFGVYNYFTGGSNPAVAQVNGNDITRTALDNAYQQQQNRLRQMLKDRYDPAMFDESTMRRQALDQLINQAVLSDFVRNNGFQISNDALLAVIRQQQFFQVDGKFSPDRYRNVLKQNGMTPDQYESRLRHDQMVNQLQQAVAGSAVVTNRDLARFVALQMQKRQLSWIRIKAASFRDQVDVGDKDIKTYYDKHRDAFQRPEQVKLSYIELSPETLSGQIKVSDEELKDRYEQVKDTKYTQPGQRKVSHILV
ncbi:MAG: SurA N-terminal domain-containing protein, partial [Ectothiorhodospiraceae bacterium]